MKSQDILVALKLVSLGIRQTDRSVIRTYPRDWPGWDDIAEETAEPSPEATWTYQKLGESLGISPSDCHAAIKRCLQNSLLRHSRQSDQPVPVHRNIEEFAIHGIKYVFPAEIGTLTRGIPTTYAAPVLSGKLMASGDHCYVWPDGRGQQTGLAMPPIHKTVPFAVRKDPVLYELLALIDAIRFGRARESGLARDMLSERLRT
jgi:hypothetical protein